MFYQALLLLFSICVTGVVARVVASERQARVVCYYTNWSPGRSGLAKYSIDMIPGDKCTHINYAFGGLTTDTYEVRVDQKVDIDDGGFLKFRNLTQKFPKLKLLLSLGGWSEGGKSFSTMAKDPELRKTFIASILKYVTQYNFHGIDLDWDYPGQSSRGGRVEDKDNYRIFVKELRALFDKVNPDLEISITVPVTRNVIKQGYSIRELCSVVDAVNVKGYDMRGSWLGYADVHSPLYRRPNDHEGHIRDNLNDGLHFLEKLGCPRHKLIVGVPFYGRSFTLSNATNNGVRALILEGEAAQGMAGRYLQAKGFMAYYEICSAVQQNGWTKKFDDMGKVPYAYHNTTWVGYEDPKSLKIKMDYIRKEKFGGTMFWSLDYDDFRSLCGVQNPLIEVLHQGMKDYNVPINNEINFN